MSFILLYIHSVCITTVLHRDVKELIRNLHPLNVDFDNADSNVVNCYSEIEV